MKKANLFKGISAIACSLFGVAICMSALAFEREGDINRFLGIKADLIDGDDGYQKKFSSETELYTFEEKHNVQMEEEGSVLLRNVNHALPLSEGERKVTLFGNTSVHDIFHGSAGGAANKGISLHDSLVEAGFSVNDTVYNKVKDLDLIPTNSNIAEAPASVYSTADLGDYKDVAIVVIGRYAGEANDFDVNDSYGVPELSFHQSEKEMMDFVTSAGFGKVVVLLNTTSTMDLGWLEDYNVDACIYTGYYGYYGTKGVAAMLKGEASPSGHLVDTYATSSLSSPAMANYGDYRFSDLGTALYHSEYMVYAEGIYIGYKYYETRYFDQVNGLHNASSSKGSFIGSTWDYEKEVIYPFGYGSSYATFEQRLDSLTWNQVEHTIQANVTVKNTSATYSVPTKDVIQLYVSLPYEDGQVEKSAIQIIGYEKTDALAQGEEKTYTISIDDYFLASYDSKATNGKDPSKKGCYTLDAGDYYFAIGNGSHAALNNILALQGKSNLVNPSGTDIPADASNALKINLASYDNTTYATNPTTGNVVSNQFDEIDINTYIPNKVTYLSRNDWETFPEATTSISTTEDATGYLTKHMKAKTALYEKLSDAPDTGEFTYGQDAGIRFIDMLGVEKDDPKWDTFINQLTVNDLLTIIGDKRGNAAITSVVFPATAIDNGPDGVLGMRTHVDSTLACCTYNKELIAERGELMAQETFFAGLHCLLGGGANLHRIPYGGRAFEYYSEDAVLSYYAGRVQSQAMQENGLLTVYKHFVANDQELNRHGVATFMYEQAFRQNQLRGFEGLLTKGASLSVMTSYNRIGVIPTAASKPLLTNVMRGEWGFEGFNMTDSSKDATSYMFTPDCLEAGTDLFLNDSARSIDAKTYVIKSRDGHLFSTLRDIAKRYFYSYLHSKVINGLSDIEEVVVVTPWWKTAIVVLDVSIGVIALAGFALAIVFAFVKRGEN